tara:strand:+ start:2364 stop:2645 length:282 start_codon:yes stop_codon:yes gene_type:complete
MSKKVAHIKAEDFESDKGKKGKKNYSSRKRAVKPVQQHKKEIHMELLASTAKPISMEVFQKTKAEKDLIKAMKKKHKDAIRKNGKDPSKHINP